MKYAPRITFASRKSSICSESTGLRRNRPLSDGEASSLFMTYNSASIATLRESMRTFPMASPQTGNPVEDVNLALATMRPAPGRDAGLERARGMWAKQDRPSYRSLGIKPHVDKAADQLGFKDRSLLLRAEQTWHMSQIQNSLGYLSEQNDPKAQRDLLDRVSAIRNALYTAVVAADTAIQQAADALGLPVDLLTVEPAQPFTVDEPSPLTVDPAPSIPQWEEETTDEPEQLRPTVDSGERGDIFGPPKRRGRRSPEQTDRG